MPSFLKLQNKKKVLVRVTNTQTKTLTLDLLSKSLHAVYNRRHSIRVHSAQSNQDGNAGVTVSKLGSFIDVTHNDNPFG